VPVGPATCRRCLVSTPLSCSAARSMSALASDPTCVILAHVSVCAVGKVPSFVPRAPGQRIVSHAPACQLRQPDLRPGQGSKPGVSKRSIEKPGRGGGIRRCVMLPFLLRMCSIC
jgi:hypothetical protein